MTIVIKHDDGTVREYPNILTYNFWDEDDIQCIAGEMFNTELSESQLKAFRKACDNMEHFPDSEDVRWIIREITGGKK